MLIRFTTQGSLHSMLSGMQAHLVVEPPCMIVPTPTFAALPLTWETFPAVGAMLERCTWESVSCAPTVRSSYTTMEVDGVSICALNIDRCPGIHLSFRPHLRHPPEVVKQEAVDVPVTPITEVSTTASSSMTLADIMAGPIPTGPLPLPEPISEEPPPPEDSLPFVEEETEDLTPEQEEALLQAGMPPPTIHLMTLMKLRKTGPLMLPGRRCGPHAQRCLMKKCDLRQFNFAVNHEGLIVSRYRKDGFASKKAAFALVQAGLQPQDPPPPWSLGKNLCVNVRLHKRSKYGRSHRRVLLGKPKSVKILMTPRCDRLNGDNRRRSLESLHRC